jgi:hypothetical protein
MHAYPQFSRKRPEEKKNLNINELINSSILLGIQLHMEHSMKLCQQAASAKPTGHLHQFDKILVHIDCPCTIDATRSDQRSMKSDEVCKPHLTLLLLSMILNYLKLDPFPDLWRPSQKHPLSDCPLMAFDEGKSTKLFRKMKSLPKHEPIQYLIIIFAIN